MAGVTAGSHPDAGAVYEALVELLGRSCVIDPRALEPELPLIRLRINPMNSDQIVARLKAALGIEIDFSRIAPRWLELTLADLAKELASGAHGQLTQKPTSAPRPVLTKTLSGRNYNELSVLTSTQAKALSNVDERCLPRVVDARQRLLATLAVTEADLDQTMSYLRQQARVAIQFHPERCLPIGISVVDSFIADPVYKNQFQTLISSGTFAPVAGSCRDAWEHELFGAAYHDYPLCPEERPKYGSLLALGRLPGKGDCYGRCFFALCQDVKLRTTFCPTNSSQCNATHVSTNDTLEILLDNIATIDIEYARDIVRVAHGRRPELDRCYHGSFIEAQIHGPVVLSRDVDWLVIDTEYLATPYGAKLLELANKIGVCVKYTDQSTFRTPDQYPDPVPGSAVPGGSSP